MKGMRNKLNQLLLSLPREIVITSSWLHRNGISYRMLHHNSSSDNAIFENIGLGAYVIKGQRESLKIVGALFSLAMQLGIKFHIGAINALEAGYSSRHFMAFKKPPLEIFMDENKKLPKWFEMNFKGEYCMYQTRFLNSAEGLQDLNFHGFDMQFSSMERAILEIIFLNDISLREVAQIMETLTSLRPIILQTLLENCLSIRVKRVFLYLAEKQKHSWFNFLNLEKINLGKGKRVISDSGRFDKKYGIVIEDLDEI